MGECGYCFKKIDEALKYCEYCGAPQDKPKEKEWRGEPFFHDGYMVWRAEEMMSDILKYYFYLGERLVEVIEVTRGFLYQIEFDECEDIFPFVWELFKIAQGHDEVLKVKEANNISPAIFEIRRIDPETLTQDEALIRWQEVHR